VILSISNNPAVSETRRLVLEQRGFTVIVATNFAEVQQKCQGDIACIIVGTDVEPKVKRAIGHILAESCPQTPLLEICRISPEIEGASTVLSDAPEDLVAAIDDLLKPTGRRYTEQLGRRAEVIRKKAAESTALAAESIALAKEMRARIRQMRAAHPKLDGSRKKKSGLPSPSSPPKTPRNPSRSS